MKRPITTFLSALLLLFFTQLSAQPIFTVSPQTVTAAVGQNFTVDVSVSNFTNIVSFQYSMNWNAAVLQYVPPVSNITTQLSGFTAANFGTANVGTGKLSVSWFDPNVTGVTLPNGTVLYSLTFKVLTASPATISFTSTPTAIEVTNPSGTNIGLTPQNASVNSGGGGGGGGGGGTGVTGFAVIASDEEGPSGSQICVQVSVNDFDNIVSMQYTMTFNPAVLQYASVGAFGLPDLGVANFGVSQVGSGKISLSWFDATTVGVTKADGDVIYQVCFNAIGPNNCSSPSQFGFSGTPTSIEITNASGANVPFQGDPGDITICSGPAPGGLAISGSIETAAPGSQVCVDVLADNFTSVASAQWSMHFNQAIIQYASVSNFGIPDVSAANFGTTMTANGTLTFSWFDPATIGVTVPNGTVLFSVCFTVVGTNGQVSPFSFNGTPVIVEVTNGSGATVQPSFTAGSVTIGNSCPGPVAIGGSPVISNVSCKGQSTGAIDISVSGGNNAYTYAWSNSFTGQDPTGLPAGTYTVTVTSCSNSVMQTASYTITEPATSISAAPQVTHVACFGQTNGAIILNPTGGTTSGTGCSGYTFLWSTGATTQNLNNIAPGAYKVTITDCKGCQFVSNTIEVTGPPSALTATGVDTDVNCIGQANGSITITATGGVAPYMYQLTGNFQTQNTFSNLSAGSYAVKTRDALNCTITTNVTVGSPQDISISTTAGNATSGCNGTITTSVSGGSPGFTYSWTGPSGYTSTSQNLANLCAGTYCVTVSDSHGCTKTKCQLVTSPLATSLVDSKNACFGVCDGSIDIGVTGGIPPYTYAWTGPSGFTANSDVQDVFGLCPGNYSVTVTSTGDNQTSIIPVTITQATAPISIIGLNVQNLTTSNSCNGAVTINGATGGFGTFTYNWSSGQTTQSLNNLCGGTYIVTVTDKEGCTTTMDTLVEFIPTALVVLDTQTTTACYESASGSLSVQVSGGVAPYNFTFSGPTTVTPIMNNQSGSITKTGLITGLYTVTITDNGGPDQQSKTVTVFVDEVVLAIGTPDVYPSTPSVKGKITLQPSGGTIPYSFIWSNGFVGQNPTNLDAGCYTVTVGDNTPCYQVFGPICIGNFKANGSIDPADCPNDSGSITLAPQGSDNAPFTYEWKNEQGFVIFTGQNLVDQPIGTYTVKITDALGVTTTETFEIEPLSDLSGTAAVTSNFNGFGVRCFGGGSGEAVANPVDGIAPYSYSWSNGGNSKTVNGLSANTYTVTITDAQGCEVTQTVVVTEPSELKAGAEGDYLGCGGTNSGQACALPSGGVPDYSYLWNDKLNQSAKCAILLEGGDYKVTVTDKNNCTLVKSVTITEPDTLRLSNTSKPDEGGPDGQAIAIVNGGTSPYEYQWMGYIDQDSILSELLPGTYLVKVTDANGCEALTSIKVGDGTQCLEYLPVITPEGDGHLEEFIIGCLSRYSDNHLEIYNRWGQLVYEANNYNDGELWRGINQRGDDVPDGVYFFVFEYNDPVSNSTQTLKGSVSVIRK